MEPAQDYQTAQKIKSKLSDPWWRLCNLYYITNEHGQKIKFKPNWAQALFYRTMWYLNIILKARQLGFTTFIQIFILDRCLFNSNVRAGVIAHNKEDAQVFFRDKIKFAYDNLPDWLKDEIPAIKNDAGELVLANNSSIRVGTSMRSGTLQYLHVSEFGKICKKYPEKAKEIVTGAFNAVHAGQFMFIESTAEGRGGYFFDYCKKARNLADMGRKLTKLQFKFFFFPWYKEPKYALPVSEAEDAIINDEENEYFKSLDEKHGIKLSIEQKLWYTQKSDTQGDDMKREYPSTPDEAFEQAIEGAYYAKQMAWIRKNNRITKVPHNPAFPVYTFWDLGRNDMNTIWFMQRIGMANIFIKYYENNGEPIQFYARYLQQQENYTYATCYLPHDAEVIDYTREDKKTRKEILESFGFKVDVVSRVPDKDEAHQAVRDALYSCWFDESGCEQGIVCLDNYRKEWDDKNGVFKNQRLHDYASHGNDSFEQFARGFNEPIAESKTKKRKSRNWRTI